MATKYVKIDFDDFGSIKRAERKKALLEKLGYNLERTLATGMGKFTLTYYKNPRLKLK